ncbi:MAG: hypothetical protein HZA50_18530, partial [Planctomycetes bacterium]|nr:hypothetical protein [Planctomycetota bacterium]
GSVKVADQEYQGVLYRKGGRELTALVPNKKADDGKMVPDGDMLAQAQKFAEFDYVDVETSLTGGSTFIKSVKPYEAPKSASFVKINAPESGANPPLSTVEVKADGKSVVLYVRPGAAGGASDPAMLAKIRAFRADQAILFKSAEESGKQWLSDIRADASTSTSSVTVAPAAGGVITLNGTFTRQNRPAQTPLKAVLTPSGANEWKVTFTFNYENQAYTYVGTITGNLRNGPVNCRADGSNRHYGFSGTANNGVLTFDCFESTDNYRTTIPKGVGTLR